MEQTQKDLVKVGLAIVAIGLLNKALNYEKKDTVNYRLLYRGTIVYEGICYVDRLDARLREHRKGGKIIFDDYRCSRVKKGSLALYHEEVRIKRHRPKYNKQHNC